MSAKQREYNVNYYNNHVEYFLKKRIEWYEKNKEHFKNYQDTYRKNNKEVFCLISKRNHEKLKQNNSGYHKKRVLAYYHRTKLYRNECKRLRNILLE